MPMEKAQARLLRAAVLAVLGAVALAGMLWRLGPQARKPLPEEGSGPRMQEPTITLYINETGQKKRIRMEEYIAGVVAAETSPGWPHEVLAAQAILARTFTMHKIAYEKGVPQHGADASTSTEEFQAYDPSRITPEIRRAVEATRGMVVRYKGRYIRAWFHSNAGGRTATAAEGLDFRKEPTPYIAVVSDPGQKVAPPDERTWTAYFPLGFVRSALRKQTGRDPGEISSASVAARGPSGRATLVRIGDLTVSGPGLRLALGPERMKSTLIDRLEVRDGQLVVSGRGRGHGVGMSQWGAYYLARQGKSPEEIIRYYFKGVTVDRIWR